MLTMNSDGSQVIQRMCYESLSTSQKETCDPSFDSTTNICRKCLGDDCNAERVPETWLSCYTCAADDSCEDRMYAKSNLCKSYHPIEQCIAMIKEGKLHRLGCYSELSESEISDCVQSTTCTFSMCDTNDCNSPDFFQQPISCVQCHSSNDRECTTNPQSLAATPCRSGSSVDFCYAQVDGTHVNRGCLMDLNQTNQVSCSQEKNCMVCRDTQGCNCQIFPENRRFCHQCDSRTKVDCANEITVSPSICENYYEDTKCFHVVQNDGVIIRACSNGRDGICSGAKKCEACDGDGCNSKLIFNGASRQTVTGLILSILIVVVNMFW